MRHQMQKSSSFGRHRGPRKALIRGLVNSLVEQERIKTTLTKAKSVRPLIEKAITMGKKGDVHSRRLLLSRYPSKKTVDKIMKNLSPRFKNRQGGYTRIIKLGFRAGDQAPLAYLEFVDYKAQVKPIPQKEDTAKAKKKEKAAAAKEDKKNQKEEKVKTKEDKAKQSANKSTEKKLSQNKKQIIAKTEKKRKRARLQQKKSRRINR